MIYCRTCDLGFCENHRHLHPKYGAEDRHQEDDRPDLFCCVCSGIYRPKEEE